MASYDSTYGKTLYDLDTFIKSFTTILGKKLSSNWNNLFSNGGLFLNLTKWSVSGCEITASSSDYDCGLVPLIPILDSLNANNLYLTNLIGFENLYTYSSLLEGSSTTFIEKIKNYISQYPSYFCTNTDGLNAAIQKAGSDSSIEDVFGTLSSWTCNTATATSSSSTTDTDEDSSDPIAYDSSATELATTEDNGKDVYDVRAEKNKADEVYYDGDYISTRRPLSNIPGSFFLVDIVYFSRNGIQSPILVSIPTKNDTKIQSLKLNTSPKSLVINGGKKINTTQTLTRWVEEHWGDEIDQITFSGDTFAFINTNSYTGGLTITNRFSTTPYQELQHLVNIYRMNGCAIVPESINNDSEVLETNGVKSAREFFNFNSPSNPYKIYKNPRRGMIQKRYYIRLKCDFAEFIGFFESFDVIDNEESPFKLSFEATFKSEHTRWFGGEVSST